MLIHTLFGLLFFSLAAAAPAPSSREVLLSAGVSSHKISQLDQGEIITHGVKEGFDKELAMSVAIYLPAHPDKVMDYIKSVELFAIDSDVTAYGAIPKNANANDFKGFAFSPKQIDEVLDLLDTEESDRFNLSSHEISSFSALQNASEDTDNTILVKKVSQKYREILQQRWQAYRNSGLKGIADYSRADGVASPSAELNISAESCKVLTHFFPELSHGWNNYPAALPSGAEERFYWINRLVENRPTAILAHSVFQVTNFGSLILGRQFYVGHSYNSNHMCAGVLPYRDGALVFYIESTSTDQVAGIANGLRHIIGREQLKYQMIKHLEKLSQTFGIASKHD
ncbi:MAG: hypothetical protein ABSB19_19770 [Methylomonas sp.]|jgi:hypothetical protein